MGVGGGERPSAEDGVTAGGVLHPDPFPPPPLLLWYLQLTMCSLQTASRFSFSIGLLTSNSLEGLSPHFSSASLAATPLKTKRADRLKDRLKDRERESGHYPTYPSMCSGVASKYSHGERSGSQKREIWTFIHERRRLYDTFTLDE